MMNVEEGVRLTRETDDFSGGSQVGGSDMVSVSGISTSSTGSSSSGNSAGSASSRGGKHSQGGYERDGETTIGLLIENLISNSSDMKIWFLTLILALGNAADAVEICCIGFIMTEIPDITTKDKELLTAAVFAGMFFGGLFCGFLSDSIGRKPCLLYSLGLNAVAGYASALAPNIPVLIACRVVGGIGIGGSVPSVFTLGAEMFPALVRGKLLSVVASFWMVGAIFTASVAWIMLGDDLSGNKILASTGWRSFAAVCATPALVTFVLTYFFVSESPRFLLGKKQFTEAAAALEFISGVPVKPMDLIGMQSEEDSARSDDAIPSGRYAMAKLLSPPLIKTTLVLTVIWFTLCFGSYGISTWISELFMDLGVSNAFLDSFIFSLANLPGNIVSIFYVETLGRRRLLTYGMGLSAIAAFGFAIDTKHKETVVLFAALFNAFSTVGWNSLDCLSCESFPTNVRTSAMGILAAAGRLGAVLAQFVNGSLEDNVPLLLGVTSTSMVLGGLCSWLLDNDNTGTKLSDDVDEPDTRRKKVVGSGKLSPARIGGYTSIANTSQHTHSPLSKDNDL